MTDEEKIKWEERRKAFWETMQMELDVIKHGHPMGRYSLLLDAESAAWLLEAIKDAK